MAEVYLARSFGIAGFEKQLVIKQIRPEHEDNPRFINMFINEAKIGVHLNHPNIVQVYELGKFGPSHYIAMEHLHGRDITRLIKTLRARETKVDIPIAVAILAEVCRGLAHAHSAPMPKANRLASFTATSLLTTSSLPSPARLNSLISESRGFFTAPTAMEWERLRVERLLAENTLI